MATQLDEDNYLTIQLLSYDRPTGLTERFYFLEMSTLQATIHLPKNKKITSAKVFAYTDENIYLDESSTESFKNIGDFNDFFVNNPDYYIHNCEIEMEDGITLGSHDDGEVSIQFLSDSFDKTIIDNIFEKYNLDKNLINVLKNKPGYYIAIDKQSNITSEYKNFDDYLENGRS